MRSFFITLLACGTALGASAHLEGDGYYRVQNNRSGRYVYVQDNKGSLDFQSTTAEVGAIQLWMGHDRTISDPAAVLYITDINGNNQDFDIQTQGTGIRAMIDYPLTIYYNRNDDNYSLYGRNSGMTRWLGDGTKNTVAERGYLSTTDKGEWTRWLIHPISSDTDEYFGVAPDICAGGDWFAPFFADFPFTTASSGMEVYYVSEITAGIAILDRVEGVVPRATAVVVKCGSQDPSDNRLNLGGSAEALSGNCLHGVYFENYDRLIHNNLTPYDPETMRVLGLNDEGELAFIKADIEYVPRNRAYLTVDPSAPDQIRAMTREQFDHYVATTDFTLTYMVGDQVYRTYALKAGTPITPEAAPEVEGYTFLGWNGLPETMPIGNVTVTADLEVNYYTLSVYLDGVLHYSGSLAYGTPVTFPDFVFADGNSFDRWDEEFPEFMPARDLELHGHSVTGIDAIFADSPSATVDVYTLRGEILLRGASRDRVARLPRGLYIIGGTKVLIP